MSQKQEEEDLIELAMNIKDSLDASYGCDMAFFICASPFGRSEITHYISNADKETTINWMKDTLKRFEKQQEKIVSTGNYDIH